MSKYTLNLFDRTIVDEDGKTVAFIPACNSVERWYHGDISMAARLLNALIHREEAWVVHIECISMDDYEGVGHEGHEDDAAGVIGWQDNRLYWIVACHPDEYEDYASCYGWTEPSMTAAEVEAQRASLKANVRPAEKLTVEQLGF